MKKIRLPIIRGTGPAKKILSMDDYLRFVSFNWRYTVNKRAVRKWKRWQAVNVPFSLK